MPLLNMPKEITIPMNLTLEEFKRFTEALDVMKVSDNTSHNRQQFIKMYEDIVTAVEKELAEQSPMREPDVPGTVIKTYQHDDDIDPMTFVLIRDVMTDEMKWINTDMDEVWEWQKILSTFDFINAAYTP